MRKLYALFLSALFSVACLCAQAQSTSDEETQCLSLNFASGDIILFELPDNPVVTFGDTDLTVSTDKGINVSYERSGLTNFTFAQGNNTITGIADIAADADYTVEFTDKDNFIVRGANIDEVKLFNISGACVCTVRAVAGEAVVSLSDLNAGVYLVEIPGHRSMKIVK